MPKITNTKKQNPMIPFAQLIGARGASEGIEAQEACGQQELVNSTQLPRECRGCKEQLVAAGVVFGEPTPDDPLFCSVALPPGWTKRPTDHSMWSELVDAQGNVRADIFYKAAFYDRVAFIARYKDAPAA